MKRSPSTELPFFDFDVYELNRWAAKVVGNDPDFEPNVVIVESRTLASIWAEASPPVIELHPLFNVEWLPIEVLKHVLIHEHIHKRIKPREVEPGKMVDHPPEFWELERELSPLRNAAWLWMYAEWGDILRRDAKHECTWVKRGWKERLHDRRDFLVKAYLREGLVPPPEEFTQWEDILERIELAKVEDPLF
jgi:hypothetical protein